MPLLIARSISTGRTPRSAWPALDRGAHHALRTIRIPILGIARPKGSWHSPAVLEEGDSMSTRKLCLGPARAGGLVLLFWLISACASVKTVPLKSDFWSQTDRSIAVANLPEAKTYKSGGQGLLDI